MKLVPWLLMTQAALAAHWRVVAHASDTDGWAESWICQGPAAPPQQNPVSQPEREPTPHSAMEMATARLSDSRVAVLRNPALYAAWTRCAAE